MHTRLSKLQADSPFSEQKSIVSQQPRHTSASVTNSSSGLVLTMLTRQVALTYAVHAVHLAAKNHGSQVSLQQIPRVWQPLSDPACMPASLFSGHLFWL